MPPKPTNRAPIPRQAKKNHFPANSEPAPTPRALSLGPPQTTSEKPPSVPSSQPATKPSPQDLSIVAILKQLQSTIDSKNEQLEELLTTKLNNFDSRLQHMEKTQSDSLPHPLSNCNMLENRHKRDNDISNSNATKKRRNMPRERSLLCTALNMFFINTYYVIFAQ